MLNRRDFIVFGVTMLGCGSCKGNDPSSVDFPNSDANDSSMLQASLDKGGKIVLEHGRVYRLLAPAGAKAALLVGSDTLLDLNGATLELMPNQHCTLLAQRGGGRVQNVRIINGSIVGNGSRLLGVYRNDGIKPTLYFTDCDRLELRNLEMRDTYMYAVYAQGDGGVIDNLTVENAIGGGIHLKGSQWQIDKVRVRNVTFFERVNCQGNPFIVSLVDSVIGSIHCENYGFGIKFQDGCNNVRVGSIEAIGGPNNNDYLVKIQGYKAEEGRLDRFNRNIRFGSIKSRNGPKSGLYIFSSDGVDIGSYLGEHNGQSQFTLLTDTKNVADVLIIDSDHIHFGELQAKGFPSQGLWLHEKAGRVVADKAIFDGVESSNTSPVTVRSGVAVLGNTEYQSGNSRAK